MPAILDPEPVVHCPTAWRLRQEIRRAMMEHLRRQLYDRRCTCDICAREARPEQEHERTKGTP